MALADFPMIDVAASGDADPVACIREAASFGCMILRNVHKLHGVPENFYADRVMPEVHSLFDDGHMIDTGVLATPGVIYRNMVACDLRDCKCSGVHRSWWKSPDTVRQLLEHLPTYGSSDIDSIVDRLSMRRASHAESLDFDEREWNAIESSEFPISELLAYRSCATMRFHDVVRAKLMPLIEQWLGDAAGIDFRHYRQADLCQFRLVRYPAGQPNTPGMKPHIDTCLYTVLFSDEMSALHVKCDGRWIPVPPCSGVLLFGWAMPILTNGRFRAKRHGVGPVAGPRTSCVFFADLDVDRPLQLAGNVSATWEELKVMKRCRQWRTRARYRESLLHLTSDHNVVHAARWVRDRLETPVDTRNWLERTPLHQAALAGSCEAAEFLLKEGAELDATDKYGLTPLHLAGVNGRHRAWRLLLDRGADAQKTNRWGSSPTDWLNTGRLCMEEENTQEDSWLKDTEGGRVHNSTVY